MATEGWAVGGYGSKAHYVRSTRSLCGNWGSRSVFLTAKLPSWFVKCKTCERMRDKEAQ